MFWLLLLVGGCLLGPGCSVRQFAVNRFADALAAGGSTFAKDNDPQLVEDAAPFSLKLMETLLEETPEHSGLLQSACSSFAQYAYAFVQQEADRLEKTSLAQAEAQRKRAVRLYLRARDYGLRGLEVRHPRLAAALRQRTPKALVPTNQRDVPLLYWTAVSWAAAISLSKDNPDLVAELPLAEALIYRALELDETYQEGAIHTFLISYATAQPGAQPQLEAAARRHFERAWQLSGGKQAAPLLALAESVCIQKQDLREFESLLQQALAIDPDRAPEHRLTNVILQERARWLLSQKEDLFLIME